MEFDIKICLRVNVRACVYLGGVRHWRDRDYQRLLFGWLVCQDRIRHLGGGSIVLEAIPSARSRWEAQGFVPVAGCARRMQQPVTWKNLMRGFLWGSSTHLVIIHDHPAMHC